MDSYNLKKIVRDNGVVGAGGAGFPTYAKLDMKVETIILNCAECEPLLKVHRQLLKKYSYEILKTLDLIANILEAKNIIIGVKKSYQETIDSLKFNIASFNKIEIKLLPEIYPVGDEVILIYETTKKVVPPGGIPLDLSIAVLNVETVFNIYKALNNEPVTTKYLTIAGEVENPITIEAPIGISVQELLSQAVTLKVENPIFIMGGPMTGNIVEAYDVITKTTNAVLVLPKSHYVVTKKLSNISIDIKRAMSTCCQCRVCTDLCSRNLIGHPIEPHLFMRALTNEDTKNLTPFLMTLFCSQCGLCEMYSCIQNLSPRKLISEYKAGLRQNEIPVPKGIEADSVNSMREERLVPMERLIERLDLKKYDLKSPLSDKKFDASVVKLKLSQSIGAKSIPIVAVNEIVTKNQIVAKAFDDKLSVPLHTPISGTILDINDNYITIKKQQEVIYSE